MTTALEIITSAEFLAARKANPDSCWLVAGRFGYQWQLCDPATGRALPEWIADRRGPKAALAKRGWVVIGEWASSEAKLCGEGRGLSGSVWSAAVRTDGGYPGRRPARPARAA